MIENVLILLVGRDIVKKQNDKNQTINNDDTTREENKELFLVELDLLEKFKSICKKYSLTYYASSGTLLGAVRHKGFIPWDDDIDLFLMWDDYKIFLQVAPLECQYPYFFQSYLTEEEGEVGASRIRRTDTTGCTQWEKENINDREYNRGVFIDIFPLFYIPDTKIMRYIQRKRVMFWWKCIRGYTALKQRNVNAEYQKYVNIYKFCSMFLNIKSMKRNYLEACSMTKRRKKELGATSSRCHLETLMWDSLWYDKTVELPFENTTISCPFEYDKVLTKQYGDYKTPVKNGARHQMAVLDLKRSFKEYFNDETTGADFRK